MKAARPGQFLFITREQAARLLRAARNQRVENQGERIGWALAAMKDSRHAQRLKIDYLLRTGNFDSADAMLARHLLTGREHPLMRLRFARSMFIQGRLDSAQHEIQKVIADRPHHFGSKLLAAAIAGAQGEHERAVHMLVIAIDERPKCRRVRIQLIEALLDAGLTHHAERDLEQLADPPAVLRARVLRACGRTVDALDVLRQAADMPTDSDQRRTVLLDLLDVAETAGDIHQLNRMSEWTSRDSGLAAHDQREFEERVAQACSRMGLRSESMADLEQNITQTRGHSPYVDDAEVARQWMGRLLGQLLAEQSNAATSGADPSPHLLPLLLEEASASINRQLAAVGASRDGQFEALLQHRDIIHHALGHGSLSHS